MYIAALNLITIELLVLHSSAQSITVINTFLQAFLKQSLFKMCFKVQKNL